ncbi:MAG: hypothetical protein QOF86_1337, partial [Baekduia sp.]|nr:hypothetical protein [Baekduia sp.]
LGQRAQAAHDLGLQKGELVRPGRRRRQHDERVALDRDGLRGARDVGADQTLDFDDLAVPSPSRRRMTA